MPYERNRRNRQGRPTLLSVCSWLVVAALGAAASGFSTELTATLKLPTWALVLAFSLAILFFTVVAYLQDQRSVYVRSHSQAGRYVRGHWRRVPGGGGLGWFILGRRALHGVLCAGLLIGGLVRWMRYSPGLAERLICSAIRWLPEPYREHYQAEWLAELDWLKAQGRPLLGWAVGVLSTAAMTRLALRARLERAASRVRSLPQSPVARVISRHRPLGLGLVTAAGVFCAAAVEWSGASPGASRAQVVWALAASLLAGGAVAWQSWPRGPVAEERADEPDRPARR